MNSHLNKAIFLFYSLIVTFPMIQLSAQHDTIRANELLEEGIDRYYDGAYLQARPLLQQVLQLRRPHYPEYDVKIEDIYYWLGANEQDLRNHEKALEYYQQGLAIAKHRKGPESIVVADFYLDIGNTYDQMYEVKKAKEYYEKTLVSYEKAYGPDSKEVGNVLMNIGYGQRKMGHYHTTEQYYKRAFANFQKSAVPNSKEFYRIYINQCNLLIDLGDYDRALEFAEKALEIKLMHYDTLHPSVYKYYGNIGRIYSYKNDPQKALPYAQKALAIAESTRGKQHPETAGLLGELAAVYGDLGQLDKALQLNLESIAIQEKGLPATHPYLVSGYEAVGRNYEDKQDYDQAMAFYQSAMEKYKQAPFVPQHLVAGALDDIANIHLKKGELPKALQVIQQGLQHLAPDFQPANDDWYSNPSLQRIEAEGDLLQLLRSKSIFLQRLYEKNTQRSDLEQALKTSELAVKLIEKIRRSYQSESARQFLNSDTAPLFEQGVEQAYLMYQLTNDPAYILKAFEFSEKSKASILWQSRNEQYALIASGVPQSIIDSLQYLSRSIATLEEQHLVEKNASTQKKINSQIFEQKIQYDQLIQRQEQYNPAYYRLKYAANTTPIEQLMERLPDTNTTLIEYFYTPQHLYIFLLDKKGLQGLQTRLSISLEEKILALRNHEIQTMVLTRNSMHTYIENINELYEALIRPIQTQLSNQPLIFIPHGVLHYLSFETLAPPDPEMDFRNLDYLLVHHNIQYNWSATLWADQPRKKERPEYDFLGFAPGFENQLPLAINTSSSLALRNTPAALSYSIPEVMGISTYFEGNIFTGHRATESTFHRLAPQSNIIHLATHALVNEQQPLQSGLLFSEIGDTIEDGFLNAMEIYNMDLSADLAVMSACNTGYGHLAQGEGIMSLGRAFMYAGCKSVITSLWLANDESSSTIVQGFYEYADQGLPKDEALRKAKLDYLQQADPLTAHPYFWANLVAVGDMRPIKTISDTWWIALLVGSLTFLVIFSWLNLRNF